MYLSHEGKKFYIDIDKILHDLAYVNVSSNKGDVETKITDIYEKGNDAEDAILSTKQIETLSRNNDERFFQVKCNLIQTCLSLLLQTSLDMFDTEDDDDYEFEFNVVLAFNTLYKYGYIKEINNKK